MLAIDVDMHFIATKRQTFVKKLTKALYSTDKTITNTQTLREREKKGQCIQTLPLLVFNYMLSHLLDIVVQLLC